MQARALDLRAMKHPHARLGLDVTELPQPRNNGMHKAGQGQKVDILYLEELDLLVFAQKKF